MFNSVKNKFLEFIAGNYCSCARPLQNLEADYRALLESIRWEYDWIGNYALQHLNRFAVTVERLGSWPKSSRVLELGAMPYVMSVLLKKFAFGTIEVNKLPPRHNSLVTTENNSEITIQTLAGEANFSFPCQTFNVELDTWPYADDSFDLIIASELLEHLTKDPMNVFSEVNRVLKPGGHLFITTPNAISFSNALALYYKKAPNIDPYYRPNVYDRHNREVTPAEIEEMFKAGGFVIESLETMNFSQRNLDNIFKLLFSTRILWGKGLDRQDYIFAVGRKVSEVLERFPTGQRLYKGVEQFAKEESWKKSTHSNTDS